MAAAPAQRNAPLRGGGKHARAAAAPHMPAPTTQRATTPCRAPAPHLQVHEHAARHVLAGAGLGEEGVEGVVAAADGLVGGHLAIGLDAAARGAGAQGRGNQELDAGLMGGGSACVGQPTRQAGGRSAAAAAAGERRRLLTRAPGSRAPSRRYRPGCRPGLRSGGAAGGGRRTVSGGAPRSRPAGGCAAPDGRQPRRRDAGRRRRRGGGARRAPRRSI